MIVLQVRAISTPKNLTKTIGKTAEAIAITKYLSKSLTP